MQTVSHYRIIKKLGEGGMGTVYLAKDELLERDVAIKFPTLGSGSDGALDRARFLREARLASSLNHPNIATIYDCGETEDHQPFLVMELVHGEPLSHLLLQGPLPLERAVSIIIDVANALAAAHRRGILHRDIKPSNVMIGEGDRVKVLDFGLAKQLRSSANAEGGTIGIDETTMTIPGAIVGTPLYMSPEQARGENLDSRSDLFSVGTLLYQCITGRPPFLGASLMAIGAQILNSDPASPSRLDPRLPRELDGIAQKVLAKDLSKRFQTAEELIDALRGLLGTRPMASPKHYVPLEPETIVSTPRGFETNILQPALRTDEAKALQTGRGGTARDLVTRFWWAAVLIVVVGIAISYFLFKGGTSVSAPSAAALRAYEEGTNALRDGAYLKANKILAHSISIDPNFALAHARLAESWVDLDNIDKASFEIATARSIVPDAGTLSPIEGHYLQAINDTVVGNRAAALTHYQEIARLDATKAHAYFDLGRAYERHRQVEPAIENYQKSLTLDPGSPSAHLRLGVLRGRLQQEAPALKHFEEAESIYRTFSNLEGTIEVLYQRGLMFFNLRRIPDARKNLQAALTAARGTSPSDYQAIRALLQLGTVSAQEDDFAEAEALTAEAISLARSKEIEYLTTLGVINLGNIYYSRNRTTEAEKYIEEGLALARKFKTTRYEALALSTLASLRIDQDRVDEGLRYREQARDFFERSGYRRQAWDTRILIGRTERDKGDYQSALRTFQQQLISTEQASDQASIAEAHEEIGKVLVRWERHPEALPHYEKSIAVSRALGAKSAEFYSLVNFARALAELGLTERAVARLNEASPLATTAALRASLALGQAEVALIQRSYAVARAKTKEAMSIANDVNPGMTIDSKIILGVASALGGSQKEGAKICEAALDASLKQRNHRTVTLARLGLARARLENGEAAPAMAAALEVQRAFEAAGQRSSEWRAWLIAALVARSTRDETATQEYARRARQALDQLSQQWGVEHFQNYSKRPDIQSEIQELNELIGVKR